MEIVNGKKEERILRMHYSRRKDKISAAVDASGH
jgi:hypothetical protein